MASIPGHRRLALAASISIWGAAVVCAFAQTAPDADAPEAIFRSDVTEVRVSFSTTDENNNVVATLQPSDFAVVDRDYVVRSFRSFTRSEYIRPEIALLVDASESATPQFRREVSNAVQIVTQTGAVPAENFSVISFRDLKPTLVCAGNCRTLDAGSMFPAMKSGGLTPLYDSIVFAARMLGRDNDPHVRRILVLFSDGADTISLKSFTETIDSALENDVAIYTVDSSPRPHNSPGTLVLRSLAVSTGGRYSPIEAGVDKIVSTIIDDFHATYTVAYKLPTHAAGFHQVRILPTHNPGLQFHCRRGYYFEGQEN